LAVLVLWLAGLACVWTLPGSAAQPAAGAPPSFDSLDNGLSALHSYRLSLKLRFTGISSSGGSSSSAGSQEQTVLIDAFEEAAPDRISTGGSSVIRHFLFLASFEGGNDAALPGLPGALEYYDLGGRIYTLSSSQGSDPLCSETGSASGQQASGAEILQAGSVFDLLPQIAVQSLEGARRVQQSGQSETVNGIVSDYYRLEPTTSGDGQNQVESELWVAREGNFVVRFTGAMQGPVTINVLNGSGVLGWEYNLADINVPQTIAVPEQCLALSQSALPLPENAQNVHQSSMGLSFSAPSAPQEMLQFYHQRLSEQGWTIGEEGGGGTSFSVGASRGGQAVRITINTGSTGQSLVTIETLGGQ
jgi:hypothetical protein